MNPRLLLVDGHNLLFRMFFGMPDNFYSARRIKFNAVYGFASAIHKVQNLLRPSHMLVLFDSQDCGDRRRLDDAYKANRPDYSEMAPDDCPFTQLPAIYAMLDEMKIPHREIHGCEADDVIASYAINCRSRFDVIIFSTDRDYWQLIGEHVSILDYHGANSSLITPPTVMKKFGVTPDQIADYKCLVGDNSDNITGVPGVGPKTAAALLTKFGTLENLLDHIDEIDKPKIRASIADSRERLDLNVKLIRLSGSAPLPIEPDNLTFRYRHPGDLHELSSDLADEYIGHEIDIGAAIANL